MLATTTDTTATAGCWCCHFCLWHCCCSHFSLFAKCEWLSICPPRSFYFIFLLFDTKMHAGMFNSQNWLSNAQQCSTVHSVEHLFLVMDVAVVPRNFFFLCGYFFVTWFYLFAPCTKTVLCVNKLKTKHRQKNTQPASCWRYTHTSAQKWSCTQCKIKQEREVPFS